MVSTSLLLVLWLGQVAALLTGELAGNYLVRTLEGSVRIRNLSSASKLIVVLAIYTAISLPLLYLTIVNYVPGEEVELGGIHVDDYCRKEYGGQLIEARALFSTEPTSEQNTGISCHITRYDDSGVLAEDVRQVPRDTLSHICRETYKAASAYTKLIGRQSSQWSCFVRAQTRAS